ncbi:speckle-type POZ protein-like [Microplitis mediator]|uniref:speckle-type POZ protein-like n=1 Tax=Microplitis mediator TaxID=375433 RepID=UPI0025578326|nr:speckle-type POZ protein-like [Microplitis mediator]XP_057318201.1 speckle-type POZ protein-like [Microplitis mediator]
MEDIKIIKTQSTIEERKIIYEWKINQFLSITSSPMNCATPDSIIESPVFSTTNIPGDSSWRLKISYGSSSYGPYLSIALKYCGGVEKIKAKYSICIIDDEKNRQFIRGEQAYQTFKDSRDCTAHCINANELNKEKDQYVPNDTLTVSLELTELMVRSYTSIPITKLQLEESKQIVDDLKDLFHSKEGSDVVLIVGDKKIPAHKTLLMNQSNVFREMLTCHQKNNKNNEVNIPDMNYDICKKLLEFIYTGNVTNFDEVAVRLFEAADKYQIPALKKLCEKSFCKNVNGENAVQYLVLLDRHNADQEFLNYIADFIANNSKIFTVSEYIALLNTNPALLLILTTKINNPTKNRMNNILENQYYNKKWSFLVLLLSVIVLNFGLNLNPSTFFFWIGLILIIYLA